MLPTDSARIDQLYYLPRICSPQTSAHLWLTVGAGQMGGAGWRWRATVERTARLLGRSEHHSSFCLRCQSLSVTVNEWTCQQTSPQFLITRRTTLSHAFKPAVLQLKEKHHNRIKKQKWGNFIKLERGALPHPVVLTCPQNSQMFRFVPLQFLIGT